MFRFASPIYYLAQKLSSTSCLSQQKYLKSFVLLFPFPPFLLTLLCTPHLPHNLFPFLFFPTSPISVFSSPFPHFLSSFLSFPLPPQSTPCPSSFSHLPFFIPFPLTPLLFAFLPLKNNNNNNNNKSPPRFKKFAQAVHLENGNYGTSKRAVNILVNHT